MKTWLKLLAVIFSFYSLPSQAWWLVSSTSAAETITSNTNESDKSHNEWLKKRFSKQHQQLIPVVAVADVFYACNQARNTDKVDYKLSYLVSKMDKNTLAEKLANCLGDDTMQSDIALNYGLLGCFQQQLAHLPKVEREQKMQLVKKAIYSLSHEERKKSFTQCVTEQSIHYLK